mmetsp:Transcript_55646/g.148369  ORF Transcript_55646/g.148369 Transcript_55646/m.148369 type:complete len:309 (+) Transcript_55646:697-1623(+)
MTEQAADPLRIIVPPPPIVSDVLGGHLAPLPVLLFFPLLPPAVDLRLHGLPQEGSMLARSPPHRDFAPRALASEADDVTALLHDLDLLISSQFPLRLQGPVPPPTSRPSPAALNEQGRPVLLALQGSSVDIGVLPLAAVHTLNPSCRPSAPVVLLPPQEIKDHRRRPSHPEPPENRLDLGGGPGPLHKQHSGAEELDPGPVRAGDQPPTEEPLNDPRRGIPDTQRLLHPPGFLLGPLRQPTLPPPKMGLDDHGCHASALADCHSLGHHQGLRPPSGFDHLPVPALDGDGTALFPLDLGLRQLGCHPHA